jgi:molecular chaperone GrpE (heat shock protein)
MVPAAEGQEPGTVAMVFQTGWMIHERVLRPAMVAVVQG